jgi:cyclohexyl-isocyanide hydratase
MKIACFLYPNFTSIDLIGPITAWRFVPGVEFEFIAAAKGPMRTDTGLEFIITHDFSDFSRNPDVVFVPGGGLCSFEAMQDDALLRALALAGGQAKWVTSVCTGAMILAAAGLLDGYRSSCYWYARPYLTKFGAIPDERRVVIDRNRASGGGVTAGIDFGLRMAAEWTNEANGQLIELVMEYAPEPPFNTGRPELADATTLATARKVIGPLMSEALADQAAERRGLFQAPA